MRTNKIITFTVAVLFSSLIFAQDTESTAATISKAKTKPPVISKYQKIIEERMKTGLRKA